MATLYTVLAALQAQVSAATQGLVSNSPDTQGQPLLVQVGLFWPSVKTLQDNVRKAHGTTGGPSAVVTVYDRGLAQDATRWTPVVLSSSVTPATMTVTASSAFLAPHGTLTLTFGGPITPGDAVGLVLTQVVGSAEAVVPIAGANDTPGTMAAQAAGLLMGDPTIAGWLSASVSGNVVTITSKSNIPVEIQANVGNGGSRLREIGRRRRHCQIVVWARTPDDRATVSDQIEAMIARAEADFGLTFPDGSLGRLLFYGDVEHDEATLSDTLRRDFLVGIDYPITVTDQTYAVLAPIARNTTF